LLAVYAESLRAAKFSIYYIAVEVTPNPHSHQRQARDEADDGRDVENTPGHGVSLADATGTTDRASPAPQFQAPASSQHLPESVAIEFGIDPSFGLTPTPSLTRLM
jgi:hypothetical protein